MKREGDDGLSTLHRARPASAHSARSFTITVEEGPDQGLRFDLDSAHPGRALVGTSPACAIQLTDRQVSRRHASLDLVGPDLHVADLSSKNGTWMAGTRIVEVIIEQRASLQMGSTTLSIQSGSAKRALPMSDAERFGRVIGGSAAMRRIYPLCERLAASDVPVLLEGETGTGKELLAESLHEQGPRASGPFVVFDCSAVAPSLVESQLFGHERGSFTGATAARRGVFELAHGGTLFIDEVGELDLPLQARLLRAIERGEVCRVGGERWLHVDARIVAATRRDLDREVQAGRFREDLFFRLAVTRVDLPPLRHRHGDVGRLARHFWDSLGGEEDPIPYELFERFEDQVWPGNVRELRNAVIRRLALGDLAELLDAEAPGEPSREGDFLERLLARDLPFQNARQVVVREFERRYVRRLLDKYDGDAGQAAAASGIARRYFNLLRARHREQQA